MGCHFLLQGIFLTLDFYFLKATEIHHCLVILKKKLVRYKSSGEQRVLLRHVIVHIGHVRAVSYLVRFSLETSLIVVNIIYLPSEIYNLSLSHIALLSPFR